MTDFSLPHSSLRTGTVTRLLLQWRQENDVAAFHQLIPLVYEELRRMARNIAFRHQKQSGDPTLGATALVQQAYLNLVDEKNVEWKDRAHFMAIAAREMRRILIDHWRYQAAEMHGGGQEQVSFSAVTIAIPGQNVDTLALGECLQRLETLDPEQARIIDLHFFGGLTVDEIAEVVGISRATVERKERHAKAWIRCQLAPTQTP
ncbi:MAG: sigma-70 family RNA polymerase sigma factor [Blastocatellia bacterium]|nr:sigma-70 family RNA polymerase sigma factor [Blastocatellia bacterium]